MFIGKNVKRDLNMDDLISVIVPVFNSEPYLEKCLNSLVRQSHKNIEIITVNDGSTDKSPAILERFAMMDPRIKVLCSENKGLSAARNIGLDGASGDWLMFVDSDDYVEVDYCEHSLENVIRNNAEIGIVSYRKINIDGSVDGPVIPIENNVLTREQTMQRLSVSGLEHFMWNKIFRRDIFEGIRFPEGELWEDIAVFHLLADRAKKVSLSDEQLYNYVRHPGTIMGSNKLRGIKWPYLQNKKQFLFLKKKYPQYADSMHIILSYLGLKYVLQLAERKDPFPILKREQEFLKEIPAPKGFSIKERSAYWLMTKFPRVFYRLIWILYRKKACEDS